MNLTLKVWRQSGPKAQGKIETYEAKAIPTEASFLEMLDIVNERLIIKSRFISNTIAGRAFAVPAR
jgi:succinate dehydrogenase / fumarate reductase iron-sulfur subunit